jgi:thioredoxin-dependent peroxiredoxin
MPFPEVGAIAPNFEAKTDADATVNLSDYRGKQVVLYFYPKADTPGCTTQACAFRDNYGAFEERDVVVLGASPDTVEEQKAFKEKYDLPFTLIADADHKVAELYGVWGDHSLQLGQGTFDYTGARRCTFIIDAEGKVIDARWGVDPANDTQEVLDILENAKA